MPSLFLLLILFLTLPVFSADGPVMAEGAPVKEAAARMQVPEGFAVDLIAGEPEVVQPVAMCFDARGRLWVAEGMTYPTRAPEGQGKDRILIFEDADGDGTFETRKVFIEGLNLVSGLETGFGGLYVGAAPYLLFIPDADGDDRPDAKPEVLLDGFGYQDTHETLNSFIWGPDGWLWGCHGIFTNSKVGTPGTPDGKRVAINAGVWRFHPTKKVFEVVAHGTSNPWGLDFNDWGDAFVEACVIPHLWHIIPGGYYQRQAGSHFNPNIYEPLTTIADHRHWTGDIAAHAHWGHEDAISKDVSDAGGGHAHCGLAICLSDAFPAEYRNSALFFNIHGHRLNRDTLERGGSGWIGRHAPDVMLSMDRWFLGISIKQGPDGAMYFSDWQDPTSCHRTDPLKWDRSNGRLFRLRHGEVKPWRGDLRQESDLALAEAQAGRDEWKLRMARRILQERVAAGKFIEPQAVARLQKTFRDHGDPTRRLRALWTLAACGLADEETLTRAMMDKQPTLRAWGIRIAFEAPIPEPIRTAVVQLAATETAPEVQLALCSALQRADDELALVLGESLAPRIAPTDANLTRMLWFGLERLVPRERNRIWAVALSCPDPRLLRWTARRLGGDDALEFLFTALKDQPAKAQVLLEAIRDRLQSTPEERVSPRQRRVLTELADQGNGLATELAAKAGSPEAREKLWGIVVKSETPIARRLDTLKLLATGGNETESGHWHALLDDPALRIKAVELQPTLLQSDSFSQRLASFSTNEKDAVTRLSMRDDRGARILLWLGRDHLTDREVPADVIALLRNNPDPEIRKQVIERWGDPSSGSGERRAAISEWTSKLTPEVLAKADPVKGRAVFDRTCAACHKLFGEGGEIGPELTGGQRTELSHWLENILDPNALIGQGYELHEVTRSDGTVAMGMLASENDREVVLRLAGAETRIPRKDVKEIKSLKRSMMPEGLFQGIPEPEVADLIRYLMSTGQVKK